MEREAESWFCEDSVASTKLSIAESHDDTLFNFGIEVSQIDSKEPPVWSEEESEADKLDKIMNMSDTDKEKSDGEMSFSLSLLEANVQAQLEAGLASQTKDNNVVEEYAGVEMENFFLWKSNQDETEGSTDEEKALAPNIVPTAIEEEDAGSDITSIFMWDENQFLHDESQEKKEVDHAANGSSLERLKNRVDESKEEPPKHKEREGSASSEEREIGSKEDSKGASGYDDFIKGLFVQNKSESESEVNDKYGIPQPASSESEVDDSDRYAMTSNSSNSEVVGHDDNVASVVSGAVVESEVAKGTAHASLDRVFSSDGSEERGTRSFEGTIESSAMGTEFQSTFGDTTAYSYEGTMGSTLDGNESSFYDGAVATLTSYDTAGLTIVDSSFSDDFEDPLKMFDFAGCMAAPCEDENASLSGDRSSKKKKSPSTEKSNTMSNGSSGVLTMLADYMKKETPFKHLAQKAGEEEPPRAPLSPRNSAIKSPTIANGKTPRHANKSIQKESLSDNPALEAVEVVETIESVDIVAVVETVETIDSVDPIVQDVAADPPVGSSSGEAGDENAPIETVNTGADTSINTGTCVSSVNTGADTVRAGYQSMQLRNKILSGARQKMESAMISRHQRADLQEFAAMKRANVIPRKPFPSIREDTECKDGNKDMAAVRRNRWSKPDREFLNKKKSRRRNKKHHEKLDKASKTADTKQQ